MTAYVAFLAELIKWAASPPPSAREYHPEGGYFDSWVDVGGEPVSGLELDVRASYFGVGARAVVRTGYATATRTTPPAAGPVREWAR